MAWNKYNNIHCHKFLNTSRASNAGCASNTSQGSDVNVLIEARSKYKPGFKSWLNWWVYYLNVCVLSIERNTRLSRLTCCLPSVCCNAIVVIQAGPHIEASITSRRSDLIVLIGARGFYSRTSIIWLLNPQASSPSHWPASVSNPAVTSSNLPCLSGTRMDVIVAPRSITCTTIPLEFFSIYLHIQNLCTVVKRYNEITNLT